MTTTTDPLTLLDTFDPALSALLDEQPETESSLWWLADHTPHKQTAWSVGFLHDLIDVVSADRGFPFAVVGDHQSGRWAQLFGTPTRGYLVELGNMTDDTNDMGILAVPGGNGAQATITGTDSFVSCKLRQIVPIAGAHEALDFWVIRGTLPAGFDVEITKY
ncbi:hypothetical protein [Cryobacterium sp. TMT1-66-1]|uniref:hypothetical protein n=1 Tax=Cryobacterium sp. TMT1-66-1 TaxID=1259242 RepID=UPI001068FB6B|nr:hypothetical protein [Cryobacterium sp. TMT1-66-1]TFD04168.1 hypothetical protein E3T29_16065 [Cryobacterium sp. TMT1-66-1]